MRLQIDTSPRAVSQNTSGQQSARSFRSRTPDPTSAASNHSTFSRTSSPNLLSPAPSSSSSSPLDAHPIRRYTPSPSPSLSEDGDPDYVLAMHDFTPDHRNATCLAFHAGQIIHVLNRDPSGWWDGEVDGRRGWFPSNYVATTAVAASLTEEVFPGADVSLLGISPWAIFEITLSDTAPPQWTNTFRRLVQPFVPEAYHSEWKRAPTIRKRVRSTRYGRVLPANNGFPFTRALAPPERYPLQPIGTLSTFYRLHDFLCSIDSRHYWVFIKRCYSPPKTSNVGSGTQKDPFGSCIIGFPG